LDCVTLKIPCFTKTLSFRELVEDENEHDTILGAIDTRLLVTHLLCWLAIAAIVCHGVRSLGLLAPYICVLPSLCLIILVIAVLGLSGAHDGLHRIVYWQTDLWIDAEVWCARTCCYSVVQMWSNCMYLCLYTCAVNAGALLCMSYYNAFYNNIYRDGLILLGRCVRVRVPRIPTRPCAATSSPSWPRA